MSARRTARNAMRWSSAIAGVVCFLALVPVARAQDTGEPAASPAAPDGVLSADAQSFALRVEYDLPVPAGTGTVGQANASIGRSQSGGESAHGLAGAPSQLDPVVGGRFADPFSTGRPEQRLPHAECYHPGDLVDVEFTFPTDVRAETATAPPFSYARAVCGAGPVVTLESRSGPDATTGDLAPVSVQAATAATELRPSRGTLASTTESRAVGISLLGGAIRIGSVVATGRSSTTGTAATTFASVALDDIDIGGVRFSVASTQTDGEPELEVTVAGGAVPLDASAVRTVIEAANTVLAPTGCSVTIASDPATYPQGFLFARPQPELGVRADGSLAASNLGGLLVMCDVPENPIAEATGFNPQRFQALIGFAFTSVTATGEIGGFGLGDLGGGGPAGPTLLPALPRPATVVPATPAPRPGPAVSAPGDERSAPTVRVTRFGELDPAVRWVLAVVCAVVWAALTHLGISRLGLMPARARVRRP